MKKQLLILLFVGLGVFFMNSCKKSSQDDISVDTKQALVESQNHLLGCFLLSAEEYAKIPEAKISAFVESKAVVNLNVPPVGNQGGDGSCVAWGTTYAGRSIDWQKNHPAPWSNIVNIFSPEYMVKLYGCTPTGSYVTTALNLLKSKGACVRSLVTNPSCSVPPTPAQIANAALHKITGYSTVSRTTTAIKSMLASGRAVIVAGSVNNAFMYLGNGAVLSTFTGSSIGGHCYCVVGYDDTKGAFKFMNSWGTGWASAGFGWIKYGYESTWWSEAYVIY